MRSVVCGCALASGLLAPRLLPGQASSCPGDSACGPAAPSDSIAARPHFKAVNGSKLAREAVIATVALAPLDWELHGELREPAPQQAGDLRQTADVFAFFGGPGPFLIGSTLMFGGAITGRSSVVAAGRHVTESVLLAATITAFGKGVFGRALPGVETRHAFSLGRGFHRGNGPFVSFPSGHTAAGFALAGALSEEAAESAPHRAKLVATTSYTAATLVGVARVYQHVHWPSDLPIAAAIGLWSASTVETHAHSARENRITSALHGVTLMPGSRSRVVVGWSSFMHDR